MAFLTFVFFSGLMFAVLMFAWDLPPGIPPEYKWFVHAINVLVYYAMGAVVWLLTRIFVRTPALRMSTVFAFVFLALSFVGKAYLESFGVMHRMYEPLAAAIGPRPAPTQPAPPATQSAKRAPAPQQSGAQPGCERHEDRERNHVTITCH